MEKPASPDAASEDITSSPDEAPEPEPAAPAREPVHEDAVEPVEAPKPETAPPAAEAIPEIKVRLEIGYSVFQVQLGDTFGADHSILTFVTLYFFFGGGGGFHFSNSATSFKWKSKVVTLCFKANSENLLLLEVKVFWGVELMQNNLVD